MNIVEMVMSRITAPIEIQFNIDYVRYIFSKSIGDGVRYDSVFPEQLIRADRIV